MYIIKDGNQIIFRTRILYLIRHGRYDIEKKDQDEQRLTQKGREQLIETGKYLANIYKNQHNSIQPEYIISSVSYNIRRLILPIFIDDDTCN